MSTEHEHNPEHPATETGPDANSPEIPQTPEQVMQTAAARTADVEAELAEMKDRGMRSEAGDAHGRNVERRDAHEAR